MNKSKDEYYVPCSNLYHLSGLHLVGALGVYNYELCPTPSFFNPASPGAVMSSRSLGAQPGYSHAVPLAAHAHGRVTAGPQAAVVGQAEVE